MALPFLQSLPGAARAALPIIQAGVKAGLSSRAITRAIQQSGIRISRGRTVLPAMRALRQLELQGQNVRNVNKASTINAQRLPPSITNLKERYSYRVAVRGIDPFGNAGERYIQGTTNDSSVTPQALEGSARDIALGNTDSGQWQDVTATLEHGMQDARFEDFVQTPGGTFTL